MAGIFLAPKFSLLCNRECVRDPKGVAWYNITNQVSVLEQCLRVLRQQYAACVSRRP